MTTALLRRARRCTRSMVLEPLGLTRTGDRDVGRRILTVLAEAEVAQRPVFLRELHHLTGLPQPAVLRAARALQDRGKVTIEQMMTDPLGARVKRN